MQRRLFRSFIIGGLESSTHKLPSGRRLDLLDSTQHTRFVRQDYRRLQAMGIHTIRSAMRWHLVEPRPGIYDFSSVLPMVRAAHEMKMQVIWDLCHFGWPDDLDIYTPAFVTRFAKVAKAFAELIAEETGENAFFCPINEISFVAWAAGDAAYLNPFSRGRGLELKVQLARATIEATEAIWQVLPHAHIVHVDPAINIVADPTRPQEASNAERRRLSQYEGWDMISGRLWPQIGGHPKYLDILGINYYSNNQWIHNGPFIDRFHPLYRRFYHIIREVYERYERPLFISETGHEGDERADWLHYVCAEVSDAISAGIPIEGICLYPIFCHPGWDNDRHCENGLWDYADKEGMRPVYEPLAAEVRRQQKRIPQLLTARQQRVETQFSSLSTATRPIRVCLFTDSLEPSGMGEHMLLLAEQLKQRYALTFVCPSNEAGNRFLQRAAQLGIETLPLAVRGQDRTSWEQLRDFLGEQAIDLVHVHAGIGWEGHHGIHAAHFAHVPVIVRTEHLPYLLTDVEEQRAYHAMLERVDHMITVSQVARTSYLEQGVDACKVTAIANGIRPLPTSSLTTHAVRQKLGLPQGARVVVTVGRLTEQKGHRHLLAAIPYVLRTEPHALFVWLGDGPLQEELSHQIAECHLGEQVQMLGRRSDVPLFLQAADLLVMPSLFEGMPIVLLEAMSVGLPIVATRVGGNPELIKDQVHGRLVAPSNPEALAAAILDAWANPSQSTRWAAAAQQRFTKQFTVEQMADQVDRLYQRLLSQATPRQEPRIVAEPAAQVHTNGNLVANM
jgi:glycosyltransferase involved in cell wall biosynthesis